MSIKTFFRTLIAYIVILAVAIFCDYAEYGWLPDVMIPRSVELALGFGLVAIAIATLYDMEVVHPIGKIAGREERKRSEKTKEKEKNEK